MQEFQLRISVSTQTSCNDRQLTIIYQLILIIYCYNKKENKLTVTPLMSWFRGDFGNKKGVREICKKFNIIPNNVKPDLDYADYDWTLDMDNFR